MRPYLLIALVLGITAMLGLTGLLFFKSLGVSKSGGLQANSIINPQLSTISGKFHINGVIPKGATILVSQREYKSNFVFSVTSKDLPAVDGDTWNMANTISGKTYEIIATAYSGGSVIGTSSAITVTAPATAQVLLLNVSGSSSTVQNASITGTVKINGYIPSGATLSVLAKNTADLSSATITEGLSAKASQTISYSTAVAGQAYEVTASLFDGSKKLIGSSAPLTLTAPAKDEVFTINSSAVQTTATTSTKTTSQATTSAQISGSIIFNGVAPTNSRISIFQKVYNSATYQLASDNITPVNGSTWVWSSAKPSTWYDVLAILKQRQSDGTDKDIATSTSVSAAAPATSVALTLNSNIAIPAPSSTISVLCTGASGNYWNAQLTIPAVTGAKSYWYQVGTYSGGNNVASVVSNAVGTGNQTAAVQVNSSTAYYFRYSYANVANISGSSTQFSPFSGDSQANCGN